MPFKSEAQRRFFHAATQPGFRGDADITKKDVKKWEKETPKGKKLPERAKKKASYAKLAFKLGRRYALEKNAGLLDPLISIGGRTLGWWAPAAAGAILAGPGYREEGALSGLLAGRLGLRAGRLLGARSLKGGTEFFKGKPLSAYSDVARRIGSGEAIHGLVEAKELPAAQRLIQRYGIGGTISGGALGGYTTGRLLGAQNPYGMQPVFPGWNKENPMGIRPE